MREVKKQQKKSVTLAELSLRDYSMDFLMEAAADRSALDLASNAIDPLSNIESAIDQKMPKTAAGIRKSINLVNKKMSESPGLASSVMSALNLTSKHKDLIDVITKTEVLKFSILNAMDAVRLLLLADYKRVDKFYSDQVVMMQIIPTSAPPGAPPPIARFGPAKTVPFSEAKALGDGYSVYIRETKFMLIGPETSAPLVPARLDLRGMPPMFARVPAGKLYFVERDAEGDPSPVSGNVKLKFLNLATSPAPGVLNQKVSARATAKGFDVKDTVNGNFKVSTTAAGKIENAFRIFKRRPPSLKPDSSLLDAADLAAEIEDLTLADFKECFSAFTDNTTVDPGDMDTYDLADTLVLTGLSTIVGMFTGTREATPGAGSGGGTGPGAPTSPGGSGSGSGGSGGSGSGRGGGGGGGPDSGAPLRSQSFDNFIRTTAIVKGATPAERNTNLSSLMNIIDQGAMRRELNRVVGPTFTFTEGSVERWKQLAGIKEGK